MNSTLPTMTTRVYVESSLLAVSFLFTAVAHLYFSYYYITQKNKNRLSLNIFINLIVWSFCSIFGALLYCYLIFSSERLGFIIYHLGNLFTSSIVSVSGSVTMLLSDRIFVFVYPLSYRQHKRTFVWISIFFCAICFLYQMRVIFVYQLDLTRGNGCTSLGCVYRLLPEFSINLRVIIGIMNVILSIIFEIIMFIYSANSQLHQAQFKKVTRECKA
ncbi:hypothetical protein M3Y95_01260900 [Aphelenchoides besseyi]|nr:hypothetical protein M3Y95_01260900 [Aphelenchoides besseyi]